MPFSETNVRVLAAAVKQAGGELPPTLRNLREAIWAVQGATGKPNRDPLDRLADDAAAGKLDAQKAELTISKAAAHAAEQAHVQQAQQMAAARLCKRFRTELVNGGADQILNSLRPIFDEHAEAVQRIAALIPPATTAEQLVSAGTPEQLEAWRSIDHHVAALDQIARVADEFTHHSAAQVIAPPKGFSIRPHGYAAINGFVLFCVADSLNPWRAADIDNKPHRGSRWFGAANHLQLRTVDEARERLHRWCEETWDAMERSRGKTYRGDTEVIRTNPFRLAEEPAQAGA